MQRRAASIRCRPPGKTRGLVNHVEARDIQRVREVAEPPFTQTDQGYRPRISRACRIRLHATINAAVRTETFCSLDTCHTAANASRITRSRRWLISSSVQKKLEKSCTHSKY